MAFLLFFKKYKLSLLRAMDNYDPYGIMRVNALQTITIVIGLLFVDGFFRLPGFSQAINLPILGLVITGTIFGHYARLKAITIFCFASIIYTTLLCFVINYISLLVLVTGITVATLFALSRKHYPPFINMIALVQVVASVLSQTPNSGDITQIARIILDLSSMMVLTIIFMSLFPKKYFFRIWKRALYCSIKELGEKFSSINLNQINTQQLLLTHSIRLFNLTDNLSNEEKGFFARRIALILTEIYTSLAALATRAISIETNELNIFVTLCNQFCIALNQDQPLYFFYTVESKNPHFLILQKNFNKAVKTWNKLCLQS